MDVQVRCRTSPRGVSETAPVQADAAPLGSDVRRGQRGAVQLAEVEALADVCMYIATSPPPPPWPALSLSFPCPLEDGGRLESWNLGGNGGLKPGLLDCQDVDV